MDTKEKCEIDAISRICAASKIFYSRSKGFISKEEIKKTKVKVFKTLYRLNLVPNNRTANEKEIILIVLAQYTTKVKPTT